MHLYLQCLFVYHFWLNWDLKMLVFEEKRKPKNSEINLSEQKRARTTSSTTARSLFPPPPPSETEVNLYCEHEYRDWPINVGCALVPVKSSNILANTNICLLPIFVFTNLETRQSSWQRDPCSHSNIKATVVLN